MLTILKKSSNYCGIFFLFLGIFLCNCNKKTNWHQTLKKIPKEDFEILEDFFSLLIQKKDFGFVIYGDKPMSDVGYQQPLNRSFRLDHVFQDNLQTKRGLECWRKYHLSFSSKKLLFHFMGDPTQDSIIELVLINKRKFDEAFNYHREKFCAFFGSDMTSEKLLKRIVESKETIREIFRDNHVLRGILYGYGSSNAKNFQRLSEISDMHYSCQFTLKKLIKIPHDNFSSIEEEKLHYFSLLRSFGDDQSLQEEFVFLPRFRADLNSLETRELRKKYQEQRGKIISTYRKGDFFKKTIEELMKE